MNNHEKEIKAQNRKALPRFLLGMLAAMAVGGVMGFLASYFSGGGADALTDAVQNGLRAAIPYGIPAVSLLLIPAGVLLHQAKALLQGWDGEEEDTPDAVECKLDYSIVLTNILMPITMFLLGAAVSLESPAMLWVTAEFLVFFGVSIWIQQKAVDCTRMLNPEKQGSIYDKKFQSKWMDSCDENERRQIGEAAMCAFRFTNGVCLTLWLILLVADVMLDIGLLPGFVVMVVFLCNLLGYFYSCIRQTRRRTAKK